MYVVIVTIILCGSALRSTKSMAPLNADTLSPMYILYMT